MSGSESSSANDENNSSRRTSTVPVAQQTILTHLQELLPEEYENRQLVLRIGQELNEKRPENPPYFIVDLLCKHYPEKLGGFASVWNEDPQLERDRLMVIEFFRFHKIPTDIAAHFTNAGFDTLETICSLSLENLSDIESFNNAEWLPGHKVRVQQVFSDVASRIKAFNVEREKLLQIARYQYGHCDHANVMTRTKPNRTYQSYGPNPLPHIVMKHNNAPQRYINTYAADTNIFHKYS